MKLAKTWKKLPKPPIHGKKNNHFRLKELLKLAAKTE